MPHMDVQDANGKTRQQGTAHQAAARKQTQLGAESTDPLTDQFGTEICSRQYRNRVPLGKGSYVEVDGCESGYQLAERHARDVGILVGPQEEFAPDFANEPRTVAPEFLDCSTGR